MYIVRNIAFWCFLLILAKQVLNWFQSDVRHCTEIEDAHAPYNSRSYINPVEHVSLATFHCFFRTLLWNLLVTSWKVACRQDQTRLTCCLNSSYTSRFCCPIQRITVFRSHFLILSRLLKALRWEPCPHLLPKIKWVYTEHVICNVINVMLDK